MGRRTQQLVQVLMKLNLMGENQTLGHSIRQVPRQLPWALLKGQCHENKKKKWIDCFRLEKTRDVTTKCSVCGPSWDPGSAKKKNYIYIYRGIIGTVGKMWRGDC